ncbi:MAG: SPOR domain-containing protein [Pseudomonadota bacterium]
MSRMKSEPDYDFGPYEDEYRGFEIRDDETGRGPLILVLALGVLLIFAGVVWNTYRQGVRSTEGGLPVIASDTAPYKRAPNEPGGLEVAGQDKGYYAPMDGLGDPAMQKTSARDPIDLRRRDSELAGGATPLPPIEGAETPPEVAAPAPATSNSERAASAITVAPRPEAEPVAPIVETPQVPQRSRFASIGTYQVQLSALRSESAARSAWSRIQSSAPDLFIGANLDIQRADLGAKGVFFRLRIGEFVNREQARAFCADVKAAGKDCMVVAKASG